MADRFFHARGDGVVAIYTGADDAPMDDPQGNLPRILFHSELLYPAVVAEYTGTLTLPARGANLNGHAAHNLFAHGRPGTPLVFGYATIGGNIVPLAGSVPIQWHERGWSRWVSIGADATYVKMAESYFTYTSAGFAGVSVPWRAYVTDTNF